MKKRHKLMLCAAFILISLGIIISQVYTDAQNASNIEYRFEKEPILSRFYNLPDFSECYWKASTIGSTFFGLTNYWMQGFLLLNDEGNILVDYDWIQTTINFPVGIDPNITGRSNFNWCVNEEFTESILNQNFVGYIFLDITNGIIYFDVENS